MMEQQDNFEKIKTLFQNYVPPMTVRIDSETRYDLYSEKEVELLGRKYKEIYFGSAILKPKYTGLYFMPIYIFPELLKDIPDSLKKIQTGKSCFHIKKSDDELFDNIEKLIKSGFDMYKKHKYV